jgi:hypothetical protein
VAAAIKFARECDLRVAVRSGGHSSYGTCDGGLVIDLTMMKQVEVDSINRMVRADGGLTTGELDAAISLHGMTVPLENAQPPRSEGRLWVVASATSWGRHGLTWSRKSVSNGVWAWPSPHRLRLPA